MRALENEPHEVKLARFNVRGEGVIGEEVYAAIQHPDARERERTVQPNCVSRFPSQII